MSSPRKLCHSSATRACKLDGFGIDFIPQTSSNFSIPEKVVILQGCTIYGEMKKQMLKLGDRHILPAAIETESQRKSVIH